MFVFFSLNMNFKISTNICGVFSCRFPTSKIDTTEISKNIQQQQRLQTDNDQKKCSSKAYQKRIERDLFLSISSPTSELVTQAVLNTRNMNIMLTRNDSTQSNRQYAKCESMKALSLNLLRCERLSLQFWEQRFCLLSINLYNFVDKPGIYLFQKIHYRQLC